MPARAPYIPRPHSEFNTWANNFSTMIAAAPQRYGLATADAAEIVAKVDSWNAAYVPVTSEATKTRSTVADKNDALKDALGTLRSYAQQVANSKAVSAGDKVAVGVNPGPLKWTRIQPPESRPILSVLRAQNLQLTLRYFDSLAVKKAQAKPYGVSSCQIFYTLRGLSEPRITLHAELLEQITATRSPYILNFAPSAGGQQCYLAGYWLLRNGKRGPWGPIMSFTVPTGWGG